MGITADRFETAPPCPAPANAAMPRRTATDPVAVRFGDAVRKVREGRGDSLEEVAGRIATLGRQGRPTTMDPRYLGEIELGWHAPTIVMAKKIADALDTPLGELVGDL